MKRLFTHPVWLLILASAPLPAQDFRVWTSQDARTLEAAFQGLAGDKARLQLRTGAVVEVPLAMLSEVDRDWVAGQSADQSGTGNQEPAAQKDWPRSVVLEQKGGAEVIEEDNEKKVFRHESEHYEFVCDSRIGVSAVREFSKVFEATWLVNCLLPLDIKPRPEPLRTKFLARIFTSREDYLAEGATRGSAGVYSRGKKALMLPLSSLGVKMVGSRVSIDYGSENYRTLIHEITHQMMNHWLSRLPTWYTEGSAEYVELAEYNNGRFSFSQHQSRLKEQLQKYNRDGLFYLVPIEKLMTIESAEWSAALSQNYNTNYPSALALTYFFYHVDGDGSGAHLLAWMRETEQMDRPSRDEREEAIQKHLLRERSYADIEDEVRKWLRRVGVKVADRN